MNTFPKCRDKEVTFHQSLTMEAVHSSAEPALPAITGLDVIYGEHTWPGRGYYKIPVDLNKGTGGESVYLCYSTTDSQTHTYSMYEQEPAAITNIQVFASNSNPAPESYAAACPVVIQSGYTAVRKNLNKDTKGCCIYVCYTYDQAFKPVRDVNVIQSPRREVYPPSPDWIRINQDCSEGAGGEYTYVVFRY